MVEVMMLIPLFSTPSKALCPLTRKGEVKAAKYFLWFITIRRHWSWTGFGGVVEVNLVDTEGDQFGFLPDVRLEGAAEAAGGHHQVQPDVEHEGTLVLQWEIYRNIRSLWYYDMMSYGNSATDTHLGVGRDEDWLLGSHVWYFWCHPGPGNIYTI